MFILHFVCFNPTGILSAARVMDIRREGYLGPYNVSVLVSVSVRVPVRVSVRVSVPVRVRVQVRVHTYVTLTLRQYGSLLGVGGA